MSIGWSIYMPIFIFYVAIPFFTMFKIKKKTCMCYAYVLCNPSMMSSCGGMLLNG